MLKAQLAQEARSSFSGIHRNIVNTLDRAAMNVRQSFMIAASDRTSGRFAIWWQSIGRPPVSFQHSWVAGQVPELQNGLTWRRYCSDANFFDLDPHPLFSADHYFSQFPEGRGRVNPLLHYLNVGWKHGLSPHFLFQNDWYLSENSDVLAAKVNPLEHYLKHGWREGRAANPLTDVQGYLARYPDVAGDNVDPLVHYLVYGKHEGREMGSAVVDVQAVHLLPAHAKSKGMLPFLLTERVVVLPEFEAGSPNTDQSGVKEDWPPEWTDEYWLPDMLKKYIVEKYGKDTIGIYSYFSYIRNKYNNDSNFFDSKECALLLERAKFLSIQKNISTITPKASIIIPVYNNFIDTLLCIVSILEMGDVSTFEILIADDCSTDATANLVSSIGGCVRHFKQPKNLGFVRNCNAAAEHVRGDRIILLNNDTFVFPGWLDQLLMPLEVHQTIGLVGSKLLNTDGTMQEAGGIVWKDGTAWNFGRNQNPDLPHFNYLKDVDYCSGASLAIPTTLWGELGGFDTLFEPAYCEDSDLAFRIRDHGFRTVYNPKSEVVHYEGRSHGKDTASGVKAYQLFNQKKFFARWREKLEQEHSPNGSDVLRARDRSFSKEHILIVDHGVPQWDQDAGSRTIYQFILSLLEEGYAVTFWPDNLYRDPRYTPPLQALGVEVIYGPEYAGRFTQFLNERKGLYAAALLSRPHIASKFIDPLRSLSDARLLYYGHDLHFERLRSSHNFIEGDTRAVEEMRSLEVSVCNSCDVVLFPSRDEVDKISDLTNNKVIIYNISAYGYEEDALILASKRLEILDCRKNFNILFVGSFGHSPNIDGLIWFCNEIAPLLRAGGVSFKLKVVGSKVNDSILDLESQDVTILGFVSDEDLAGLYLEAALVIAPLRYGAGVKGKVIEAMAYGVPVVTTSIGAQGIPGFEAMLYVADTGQNFAEAVKFALLNRSDGVRRAKEALAFVVENYSRKAIGATLAGAISATAEGVFRR